MTAHTIYPATFLYPYYNSIDMGLDNTFTAKVNGYQVDSYQIVIKSLDNTVRYDSGKTTLATILNNNNAFSVKITAGTVTYKGDLKWILTFWNGTESISTGENAFTNMTTPIVTFDVPTIITSKQYTFTATYTQAENIYVNKWSMNLYDGNNSLLLSSGDVYSALIKYPISIFANNTSYYVILTIETKPNIGQGMIITIQKNFNVVYMVLSLDFKPLLTQIDSESAIQIEYPMLCQNPATLNGTYSYINNFIKDSNTALSLDSGSTLKYNSTIIPINNTNCFTVKLPKGFDGIIRTTNDSKYQIGYSNSQQKFYTIINNTTDYGEIIKITENPFVIFVLSDHIIVRQYNIYNSLDKIKNLLLDDISDLPLDFIARENN